MTNCHSIPRRGPLRPYNKGMKNETAMTLDQANAIWTACYGPDYNSPVDGWDVYTREQRAEAIAIRNRAHEGALWGVWNVGDRH